MPETTTPETTTERMTIDELAAAVGMSSRNIREHQTRGLLPPPTIEGRRGFYDDRHRARLELIQRLQAEGLNLQAIGWLLDRVPIGDTDEVARFQESLLTPWTSEEPVTYTDRELEAAFEEPLEGPALERAVELGILEPAGEGRWRTHMPRLFEAGEELVRLGIDVGTALEIVADLIDHADAIAEAFVGLYIEHIWTPFDEAGRPSEGWPRIHDALDRLRPIATDAFLSVFQDAMSRAVKREVEERGRGG